MLLGPQAVVPVILAAGLAALMVVGNQPLKEPRDRAVEHFVRQKVTAEVERQRIETPGLKAVLDATQSEAIEYYSHYLERNPPAQVSSGQNFEGFIDDDDCIVIDGIVLKKNRSNE